MNVHYLDVIRRRAGAPRMVGTVPAEHRAAVRLAYRSARRFSGPRAARCSALAVVTGLQLVDWQRLDQGDNVAGGES